MSELTSTLAAETEALRDMYAALNRGDIPAAVAAFDPQILWDESALHAEGGTFRGLTDVTALFARSRATWAEGGCEPERFIVAGDKVVVFIHVRVRLKQNEEWVEGRHADAYTFRNGKVVQMRIFLDRQEALQWAGATAAGAHLSTTPAWSPIQ